MADQQQLFRDGLRGSSESRSSAWPGSWQLGATAVLSGLACWFWLFPQYAAENAGKAEIGSVASEIAEVSESDLAGALSTMSLSGSTVARLRKGSRDCANRLAWVTLSLPNRESEQRVRLRSGNYFSPAFTVTRMPVRVAIPYPAPYESGHGTLTVVGADDSLVVALSPGWHVPTNTGTAAHAVSWHPASSCVKP